MQFPPFRHPLYPAVVSLENKFGRLAFPACVRVLAIFQIAVFLISYLIPDYYLMLQFDFDAIVKRYEVWRIFSFILLPTYGIIWAIFALIILWMINDGLEQAWGSFRLTLYLVMTWLGIVVGAFAGPLLVGNGSAQVVFMAKSLGWEAPFVLDSLLFITFATLYPNHVLLLFGLIPVKAKWLALMDAVFLFSIAGTDGPAGLVFVACSATPYLVVFVPQFIHFLKHRQKTAARRAQFKSRLIPEHEAFHRCARCGATEQDDGDVEFRVEADDEEYCENCMPPETAT